MIQVTQAVRDALNRDSRNFNARLLINGTTNVTGNIRSLKIMRGTCGGEEFNLGIVYCPYITAVIDYEGLTMEELDGVELLAQIGVNTGTLESPSYSYINMGRYTVIKPQKQGTLVYLTAYGRLSTYFNDEYTDNSEQTIATIISNIMQTAGLTCYYKGNMDTSQRVSGLAGWKNIEVLQIVAGLMGVCVTEMRDGGIVFASPDSYLEDTTTTATAQIVDVQADEFKTLPTLLKNDSVLSGITCYKSISPDDESADTFVYGDGEYKYANEYMTQAIFNAMTANIGGYTYRAGSLEIAHGDPTIDPYDAIRYTDGNTQYVVPCMGMELIYDGGISLNVSSAGRTLADETGGFSGVLSQRVARTVAKAEEAQKTADEAKEKAEATEQYFWHTQTGTDAGAHITEIPKDDFIADPSGGNLRGTSDGIEVRDGLVVLSRYSGTNGVELGSEDENHVQIVKKGMTLYDEYGTPMFQVDAMASPTEKSRTVTQTENEAEVTTDSSGRKTYVWTFKHTPLLDYGVKVSFKSGTTTISGQFSLNFDEETSQNTFTYNSKNFTATISGDKLTLNQTSGTPITGVISTEYLYHYNGYYPAFTLGDRVEGEPVGAFSFVQGTANTAEGEYSSARGLGTSAKGAYSSADGMSTIASGFAQYVCGQFNVEDEADTYLLIVGNGQRDIARSNAFAVSNAGNARVRGALFTGCNANSGGGARLYGDMKSTYISTPTALTTSLGSIGMVDYFSTGSNMSLSQSGYITVNFDGYVLASGFVDFNDLTSGDRLSMKLSVYRGGAHQDGYARPEFFETAGGAYAYISIPETPIQVQSGDTIMLRARNLSGARGNAYRGVLTVRRI